MSTVRDDFANGDWELETPRLLLRLPRVEDAPKLAQFHSENVTHLSRFGTTSADARSEEFQRESIEPSREAFLEDRSCRTILHLRDGNDTVIGVANLSNFIRGAFQACYLGYFLGEAYQGQGYMTEALQRLVDFAFRDLHLHRIMANYVPENTRSGRVLERLGFVIEGRAQAYLQINGVWTEHIMTAKTNDSWTPRF